MPGLIPLLRMNVALQNKNDFSFDVISVSARVSFAFAEAPNMVVGNRTYVGEAFLEWGSTTVVPGDKGSLTFSLPLDFNLIGGIEARRDGHDVLVNLLVRVNGIERHQDGSVGTRMVSSGVSEARNPGAMEMSKVIAKSEWGSFLKQWEYPEDLKNPLEDLRQTIKQANDASPNFSPDVKEKEVLAL